MPEISNKEIKDILEKYKEKIKRELVPGIEKKIGKPVPSKEYKEFKEEYMPKHLSLYEKLCNFSEKVLRINPGKTMWKSIEENIEICHLNVTPIGVFSFSILAPIAIAFFGVIISLFVYALTIEMPAFLILSFILFAMIVIFPLMKIPEFLANSWRMKASNQMVLSVFYIVTYMRHTPNLENAIRFASDHIEPPLAIDLKKVLWDVETEKFGSLKESLDRYLETWRKWNLEFIESIHLIESSLYEPSEARRVELLDKSLDVILEETYEKMLHYAQNLNTPVTMLNMLGIVLPILGLVVLPMVVSFMEQIKWYHIAILYDVILPIFVWYIGKNVLSKRPTGYGETDISSDKKYKKYKNLIIKIGNSEIVLNPVYVSVVIFIIFIMVGISPIIIHSLNPSFEIALGKFKFLDYHPSIKTGNIIGPFGIGAAIISVFITLAFAISLSIYYLNSSKNLVKIRKKSKELEQEFASAIFQLGNRLGDGLPAEIAFSKVADVMKGTSSGNFFRIVESNVRRLGMGITQAIFDPRHGALVYFPSKLIESSMKVLSESLKKGPRVAAQAMVNISRYVKEIHRVNERLKDLMADTIASMKSQVGFLAPVIAGIVVGITSMITTIMAKLGVQLSTLREQAAGGNIGTAATLVGMFGDGMPTYFFQIIVGLYVVEIIIILTNLINGIENGEDSLSSRYMLGKNLLRGTVMYVFISVVITFIFNFIAEVILGTM